MLNVLNNLENYNNEMTISQVVAFFERQGVLFTKTMIQNYVKVLVLPAPHNRRYYKKEHLMLLVMINSLKDIYSLDEIKKCFDSFENIETAYSNYITFYKNSIKNLSENKNMLSLMATSTASLSLSRKLLV